MWEVFFIACGACHEALVGVRLERAWSDALSDCRTFAMRRAPTQFIACGACHYGKKL